MEIDRVAEGCSWLHLSKKRKKKKISNFLRHNFLMLPPLVPVWRRFLSPHEKSLSHFSSYMFLRSYFLCSSFVLISSFMYNIGCTNWFRTEYRRGPPIFFSGVMVYVVAVVCVLAQGVYRKLCPGTGWVIAGCPGFSYVFGCMALIKSVDIDFLHSWNIYVYKPS